MYCKHCGSKLEDSDLFCTNCGAKVDESIVNSVTSQVNDASVVRKSKIVVCLLAIFVGSLGIHNFYLGYKNKAIAQLLLTTVGSLLIIGPIISSIWSFVEGIIYLVSSDKTDANGIPLE